MGLFLNGGHLLKICRKTQKEPAKCLYSVLYTVYSVLLSPLWLKSVPGWPAISVSTSQQSRVGQIVWFGCLSAISQLASREGEGGGVRQLCLHSVTQPFTTWPRWRLARAGRGVVFPPRAGQVSRRLQCGRGGRYNRGGGYRRFYWSPYHTLRPKNVLCIFVCFFYFWYPRFVSFKCVKLFKSVNVHWCGRIF